MTQEAPKLRKPSNAYNIFILVLTVLSLAVWEQTAQALGIEAHLFTVLVCTVGGLLVGLLLGSKGLGNLVSSGAALLDTSKSELLIEHWQARQIKIEVDPPQPARWMAKW